MVQAAPVGAETNIGSAGRRFGKVGRVVVLPRARSTLPAVSDLKLMRASPLCAV